jgi:hypothetical protein
LIADGMVVLRSVLDRVELARHAAARNAEEPGLSGAAVQVRRLVWLLRSSAVCAG